MKYAKIENNIVVQIQPNKQDLFISVDDTVVPGMIMDANGNFSNPVIGPNESSVPSIVTMRQARLALLQAGLLGTIETAVTNGTDDALKIEWEYATEVRRDWAALNALATSINVTSDQLDGLFLNASKL